MVSGAAITPSTHVRLLGVEIDSDLSMASHVSRTVSTCFFQLRQIKSIRRNLPIEAAKTLVNAFVVSRLDYCNSTFAGLPGYQFCRLQSVMNAAVRLIFGTPRFTHITPLLRDKLHWLRYPERVEYKLCVIVYKALHDMAPSYIQELCIPVNRIERRSTLRGSSDELLILPCTATKRGERAFCCAGPSAWNKLPRSIRLSPTLGTFRQRLKTHLFQLSYPV